MTMKYFVRPDGSCEHVVDLDLITGEPKGKPHTQGYTLDSAWSRGQAWGLYGFILCHILSSKEEYLNTAKRIAHYFIASLSEDGVPDADFRAPKEPVRKDSTAGACAACGLIEIAKCVDEHEKPLYLNAAMKILKGLREHCCDFSEEEGSILGMGSEAYHSKTGIHIPIIYGDSFFIEALQKLLGNEFIMW
jgi:unsaturated chondroitin disaccharide hydrolase